MTRHQQQFDAVIFDMDGLMLDTERIYHLTWRSAAQEMGYPLDDDTLHATAGRTFPDCYKLLRQQLGDSFPLAEFQALWPVHWHRYVAGQGIPQKPGLAALLELLEARRIPKAVATSTSCNEALFTLRAGGIAGHFTTVVSGDQIQNGKPAPDIYLEAARRLGVEPARCLALEDSEAGVLAGAAAGMFTIMVPDTKQPSPAVAAQARRIFASLHGVCDLLSTG
jgi:HAD superfamily hydrolase (TIGR01509 family)